MKAKIKNKFSGLSWDWHLVVNIVLMILSLIGWLLDRSEQKTSPSSKIDITLESPIQQDHEESNTIKAHLCSWIFHNTIVFKIWYARKFAPFPGKAGMNVNYDTCRYTS